MTKHGFKLVKSITFARDMNLFFIQKLTESKFEAQAYQFNHYKKTGELLNITETPLTGYAVVARLVSGGFYQDALFAVCETEKEARDVLKSCDIALPFFNAEIRPMTDLRLQGFFLKGGSND